MKLVLSITILLLSGCSSLERLLEGREHPSQPVASTQADSGTDTFLLMGQSNMEAISFGSDPLECSDMIIQALQNNQCRGMGYSFALEYVKHTGRKVVLINGAVSGSSIDSWKSSGHLYQRIVQANREGLVIRGVLYSQGEHEAGLSTHYPWAAAFKEMVASLRQDLGLPQLPVIYTQLSQRPWVAEGFPPPMFDHVKLEQGTVRVNGVSMVVTEDMKPWDNGWHYGTEQHREIGKRMFQKYLELGGK